MKIVLSAELAAKLKRLQELRSNANPEMTYAALLNYLADQELKRLEREPSRKTPAPEVKQVPGRTPIPVAIRREVWKRDGGTCTWQSPQTSGPCGNRTFLEFDHIHPVALGGTNETTNLRLRCRAHNVREAVRIFGHSPASR